MAICMLQLHILRDFFPTSDIKAKLGEMAGGLHGRGARKIKTGEEMWGMGHLILRMLKVAIKNCLFLFT